MELHRSRMAAGDGESIDSLSNALNVHGSDPHRIIYNQFLHYDTVTTTTLAADAIVNTSTIELTSAAGFAIADEIKISNGSQEPLFFKIINLSGTTATLDTPLTFSHLAGADVTKIYTNMATAGLTTGASIAAPIIFTSHIPTDAIVHITSMSVVMTDTSAMDFTTFGGTTALPNGCALGAMSNGIHGYYTNWKKNLDLDSDAFPVNYQTKVGGGEYGLSAIYSIKNSTDSIVYLNGALGDRFELRAQDPLTALTIFKIKLQGHYEGV